METTKDEVRENEAPLLLTSFGKYVIYSLSDNRFRQLKMPELQGRRVIVTNCGWLVLVQPESQDCCLFNPISMDKIQLPQLPLWSYRTCILTKLPTESDCYVVFYEYFDLCYCRIGDEKFTIIPKCGIKSLVSSQGQIYCTKYGANNFVTLDFVGETVEFRPIELEMMNDECPPWATWISSSTWLIESCCEGETELLIVHKILPTRQNGIYFRVSRIDPIRGSCEELVNIGDRTIFLSYFGGGYCCCGPSIERIKPNCIYYTNDECDRNIHVFNLENLGTTSLPLPSPCVGRDSYTSWVDPKTFFP